MSDLQALHQRIAELDAMLAAGRWPLPPARTLRNALRAVALGLVVAVGCGLAAKACHPVTPIVTNPPARPPPPLSAGFLAVVEDGVSPSFARVNGVSTSDLVVRAWRDRQPDASLWVAAIDRATYQVRWRAGPWAAEAREPGHMLVSGGRVIVTDADATVHILDLRDGVERANVRLPRNVASIAAMPGEPDRVQMDLRRDPVHERTTQRVVVYLADAVWTETKNAPDPSWCAIDGSATCKIHHDNPAPALAKLFGHIYSSIDIRDHRDHFNLVSVVAGVGPGQIEHAVVWDESTGRPRWHQPLVPASRRWEPYPNTAPPGETALADGRIVHVYPLHDGRYRVIGRALDTGALLYDAPLPGLDYGTQIRSLTADGGEAFLVANATLIVIDAKTGAVTHRIETF